MANVIFGEKVAAAQWMAAFIGLAGTWLVIRPPFPGTGGWLLLLPLGMGFRFALYNVLTREMHGTHQRESLSHGALGVHRVELCHALGLAYPFPESGVAMIGIGVWGFVLLLFLDRALAWAPASLVAPFIYTQCIWGDALELIRRRFHPGFARTPRFNSNHGITGMDFRSRMQVQPDFQKPAT
jgi:drug/metabolite transporter (DMT)-like permease